MKSRTKMKQDFGKKDLQDGDECTIRDGRVLKKISTIIHFKNQNGGLLLNYYNEELKREQGFTADKLDIMKVTRNGVVMFDRAEIEKANDMKLDDRPITILDCPQQPEGEYLVEVKSLIEELGSGKRVVCVHHEKRSKYSNAREILLSFPESVQLEILKGVSQKQKRKLIGL